jgi:membrane-associated protein
VFSPELGAFMGFVDFIASLLRDPRAAIAGWIAVGPVTAYGFVFLIIFIETGVVFFPFLPGDSLLFASGFFAQGGGFNVFALLGVAWAAAILGDQCNFMIGHFFGTRIVKSGKVKSMTPERMEKSEKFLEKWGHLAIFLGRFFPFIRTFVPFIAGMGGMHWRNFVVFNVLGGITWSTLFTLLGYFFGGIPAVQEHFELVVVGIILVSVIPAVAGAIRARVGAKKAADAE